MPPHNFIEGMPTTSDPHFLAWMGRSYCQGISDGIRLLVLGESHYGNPHEAERLMTRKVVEDQLLGTSRQGFLTTLHRLVREATEPGRGSSEISFWNQVAFYNYVQELVGPKSRIRPSRQAWQRSAPAFVQQLEQLQPHAVLVCGRALWDHLKEVDGLTGAPEVDAANADISTCTLLIRGRAVGVAAPINHPSSRGFRRERWRPIVTTLLRRAQAVRYGVPDA